MPSAQPWREYVTLTEWEKGLWCETCALPSGLEMTWLLVTWSGPPNTRRPPALMHVACRAARYCANGCEAKWINDST